MIVQESKVESKLKKEIELIDGKALKFVSPSMSGVPGRIVFVELKAPRKILRSLQVYRAKELKGLGMELKKVRSYFKRIVGLTGTPTPNSLIDLWPQLYLLDGGKRLGELLQDIYIGIFIQYKQMTI